MKIGLFDSGVGGVSILNALKSYDSELSFYYLWDPTYMPYGPLDEKVVTQRSILACERLLLEGCQIIVIACNTATATSIEFLRSKYSQIPFVGVEPYLNAINHLEKAQLKENRLLALMTPGTKNSSRFQDLKRRVDRENRVDCFANPYLAQIIESFWRREISKEVYEERLFEELRGVSQKRYDGVILGCTHYFFAKDLIEKILGTKAIDNSLGIVRRIRALKNNYSHMINKESRPRIYYSDLENHNWVESCEDNLLNVLL